MSYPIPEAFSVLVTIKDGVPDPLVANLKESGITRIQWHTSDPGKVYEITPPAGLMEDGDGAVACSPGTNSAVLKIKQGKASRKAYDYRIIPAGKLENPPEILVEN